jgi:PAS domain S-box-containing protein
VIDGAVITFTDITSLKQLESAVREREHQLRQMAQSLPVLVWSCRPDGSCDFLNAQWLDYTGAQAAEHVGYGWLDAVHPEDRERVRAAWRKAVREAKPFDVVMRLRSKTGGYRWFKSRSVPIRSTGDEVVQWYGTHADVDDVKRGVDLPQGRGKS